MFGRNYGLPRFKSSSFSAAFPFATLRFEDDALPLQAELKAWSPFTPPDPDDSSYPLAYLEYTFSNPTEKPIDAVYYFSSMNFMADVPENGRVYPVENGFVLAQAGRAALVLGGLLRQRRLVPRQLHARVELRAGALPPVPEP